MPRPSHPERPILGGTVNFPILLAPMVGLSHLAFRNVVRSYVPKGARTMWPTEMLNSRRLPHEHFELVSEALRSNRETDLCPQILANEEVSIRDSVRRLSSEWGASGIDINMGCPVKKALSHNYGVALMGDPDYARAVVEMVRAHTDLPIGVKLRNQGLDGSTDKGAATDQMIEFASGLVEGGANWLTLHPRTAAQKRRGRAEWSQIKALRDAVPVAVIGNGDVQTAEDVDSMLEQTQCDAVMVGRALTARPWLLWQWADRHGWPNPPGREGERPPNTPEEEAQEMGQSLIRLIDELTLAHPLNRNGAKWSESLLLRKYRFYLRNACPWLEFGHTLEARVSRAANVDQAKDITAEFFAAESLRLSARTELRY